MKILLIAVLLALASPVAAQQATAVAEAVWWSETASQALVAVEGLAITLFLALSPMVFNWVKSKSKLAALALSMGLLEKLNAGITAMIRAEAERLRQKLPPAAAKAAAAQALPTTETKEQIVANVRPKVEAAFAETLQHFGKKPGSQAVTDLILGRVDTALAKPEVPHVLSK